VKDAQEGTDEVVGVGVGAEITVGDGVFDRGYKSVVDEVVRTFDGSVASSNAKSLKIEERNSSFLLRWVGLGLNLIGLSPISPRLPNLGFGLELIYTRRLPKRSVRSKYFDYAIITAELYCIQYGDRI